MEEFYWIITPTALKSVGDPQRTGLWLEALSKTVDGSLTPGYVVDAYKAQKTGESIAVMDRPHENPASEAERLRVFQACQMILCLGVRDRNNPEWLRAARIKAREDLPKRDFWT